MTTARRSRPGRQRGAALVEFALVLPLLLAIAVGIVYYGYAFVLKAATESAAQNGAQEAVALSPLLDDYDPLQRACDVAQATIEALPGDVRASVEVLQSSTALLCPSGELPELSACTGAGELRVRVQIDLSDENNTVLPQFELGRFRIPPRPTVIESYACASI